MSSTRRLPDKNGRVDGQISLGLIVTRRLIFAGRATISVTLIALIIDRVRWGDVASLSAPLYPGCLAFASLIFLAILAFEVGRMHSLFPSAYLANLVRIHCVGQVVSFLGPGQAGADAYRAFSLKTERGSLVQSATLIMVARSVGLAVSLLALIVTAYADPRVRTLLREPIAAYTERAPAITVIICLLLVVVVSGFAVPTVRLWLRHNLRHVARTASEVSSSQWVATLLISAAIIGLRATMIVLLTTGLGGDLDSLAALFTVSAATVATAIPLSVGGIGVRDGALVVCLAGFGLSEALAFAVAIISRIFSLIPVLCGVIAIVRFRGRGASNP